MSLASHAVMRLRKLWRGNHSRHAALIFNRFNYSAGSSSSISPCLLEPLEPRIMLTTYVVNSLSDAVASDGVVTLKEALEASAYYWSDDYESEPWRTNYTADTPIGTGDDTIIFAASLEGGTISYNLNISFNIKIIGPGSDKLTIDVNEESRDAVYIFHSDMWGPTNVTITGLTITGAKSTVSTGGFGIENFHGNLTLDDVVVCNNSGGGGIYSYGNLTMTNCIVTKNHGYGVYVFGSQEERVSMTNVVVSGNYMRPEDGVGPGGIEVTIPGVLTNVTVAGNFAWQVGGVYVMSDNVALNNCVISQNHSIYTLFDKDLYIDPSCNSQATKCYIGGNPRFVSNPNAGLDGEWGTADDYAGNLHPMPNSPLIDAGSNTLAVGGDGYAIPTDLDGFERIMGGVIDIGAYELHGAIVLPPESGDVTTDKDTVTAYGELLALTVTGAADTDGTVEKVYFYLDANHNGVLDDNDLLIASDLNGFDGWGATVNMRGFGNGDNTILAVAVDNDGNIGIPASVTVHGNFGDGAAVFPGPKNKLVYQDADGDWVTVTISGGGDGYIVLPGETGDAEGIFLTGTTAKTSVSFSVKPDKTDGGTGYTTIGGIETDGLIKSITGKTVNLNGEININTGGDAIGAKDSVTVTLAAVEDSSINAGELPIKSLTVANWVDTDATTDTIQTSGIGKLSVKGQKDNKKTAGVDETLAGNFAADIQIANNTDARGTAIGSISISGNADGMNIDAGNWAVGAVTVGQWSVGSLAAGVVKSITTRANKNFDDVNGDFGADLTIFSNWFNENFKPVKTALGNVNIKNDITGGSWSIGDGVGNIKVSGKASDWSLDVSEDAKSITMGGLFDSALVVTGSLGSVSVKGWKIPKGEDIPVFTAGSTIYAEYIKSASLMNWDTNDMTQLQAPAAGDILALKYTDTADKTNNFSWKFGKPEPWDEALEPIAYVG